MTDWKPITGVEANAMTHGAWVKWAMATHDEIDRLRIMLEEDETPFEAQRKIIIARAIEGTLESCEQLMRAEV